MGTAESLLPGGGVWCSVVTDLLPAETMALILYLREDYRPSYVIGKALATKEEDF